MLRDHASHAPTGWGGDEGAKPVNWETRIPLRSQCLCEYQGRAQPRGVQLKGETIMRQGVRVNKEMVGDVR